MNENDLRDLLPDERSLPSSRRRDMKERLMVQIQQEEKATRNHFRLIVGAAAASLIAVVGTVAVLAANDQPETTITGRPTAKREFPVAEEVARAQEGSGLDDGIVAEEMECYTLDPPDNWSDGAEGWHRTNLDLSQRNGPKAEAQPVTADVFAGVCVERLGTYTDSPGATFAREVCVQRGEIPTVVVAVAEAGCEDAHAHRRDGSPEVVPVTDGDLAEINRLRAIEYAMLAPPEACPTSEQVGAWVDQVMEEEDLDLLVVVDNEAVAEPGDTEPTPPPECPRFARIDWGTGIVTIQPFRS